jgi:ferredoxin
MAIKITEECINCGACEPECPNTAIYEGGATWELSGKTYGDSDAAPSGANGFFSNDFFYIVPDKCTECVGFHDEPQCAAVCPVDCCIPDTGHVEDKDSLLKKKEFLDNLGR